MRKSFEDIVDLWESLDALAAEVGAKPASVRKWRQRKRIPSDYWIKVAQSPVAAKAGVTVEELARFGAETRS